MYESKLNSLEIFIKSLNFRKNENHRWFHALTNENFTAHHRYENNSIKNYIILHKMKSDVCWRGYESKNCLLLSFFAFVYVVSFTIIIKWKKKLNYIFQNLENKAKGKTSKWKWSDRREKKANSVWTYPDWHRRCAYIRMS